MAQLNQYGVQIGTAEYVSIIGGQISQCGTTMGNDGSANVCISGSPTCVNIENVNLSPVYAGANAGGSTGSTGSGPSQYGLLILGNPTSVLVSGCYAIGVVSIAGSPGTIVLDNCSGLTSVVVTGSPTSISITNCAGYNDQNTPVNTLANISAGIPYSAHNQGSNGGTNYYGPSIVTFTANPGGGTFQVNGVVQTPLAGQIVTVFLLPYDTIQFNTLPAALNWTGK